MRLVYCERSSHRGLLLWNGGCVSFLCISEVNRVSSNLSLERIEQQFSPCLPSDTLGDMRMVNLENPKRNDYSFIAYHLVARWFRSHNLAHHLTD